jgi:hypothetical protein
MTFFESLQYRIQNFLSSEPGSSNYVFKWVLVGFIILFFVGAILVLARYPKSIFASDKKDGAAVQTYWTSADPSQKLEVSFKEAGVAPSFNRYTMMVDMVWDNTRISSFDATKDMVFRHLLHRGSDDAKKAAEVNTALPDYDTAQELETLTPNGLPATMNPGIMVDPVKNDMIIFIDTEKGDDTYRESVRIPDIPMNEPFTLTIVVQDQMMEIYINCRLEISKLLNGMPRTVRREIYGLTGRNPLPAGIRNLRVWNTGLGVIDIRGMCKKKPVFNRNKSCIGSV